MRCCASMQPLLGGGGHVSRWRKEHWPFALLSSLSDRRSKERAGEEEALVFSPSQWKEWASQAENPASHVEISAWDVGFSTSHFRTNSSHFLRGRF